MKPHLRVRHPVDEELVPHPANIQTVILIRKLPDKARGSQILSIFNGQKNNDRIPQRASVAPSLRGNDKLILKTNTTLLFNLKSLTALRA